MEDSLWEIVFLRNDRPDEIGTVLIRYVMRGSVPRYGKRWSLLCCGARGSVLRYLHTTVATVRCRPHRSSQGGVPNVPWR